MDKKKILNANTPFRSGGVHFRKRKLSRGFKETIYFIQNYSEFVRN
jgi:hypothetical protein